MRPFSATKELQTKAAKDPSKQEVALTKITACSKAAVVSAIVDVVTSWNVIRQQQQQESVSPETWLTIATALWKIGFAAGLYRCLVLFRQGQQEGGGAVRYNVIEDMGRVMAPLWRRTSWILILASAFQILGEDTIRAFIPYSQHVLAIIILLGSLGFRQHSARETSILLGSQKDKEQRNTTSRLVIRNMALCTGALLFEGATTACSVFFQPTLLSKLMTLSGVQSPFVTAGLLWQLRRTSFWNLVDDEQQRQQIKASFVNIQDDVWEAQDKFYSNVRGTFISEIVSKIVISLLPIAKKLFPSSS